MEKIKEYSEEEKQNFKKLNKELISKIKKYRPEKDLSKIDEAFWFAVEAHKNQRRKSGEPFVHHPIVVTDILAGLKLDRETLIAGLLHDVVEDTPHTEEDIEKQFGEEVAFIVARVTKLFEKEFNYKDKDAKYANNYKNMLLGSAKDPRVILVKIADRLHNMKTLEHMTPEKQREKAEETMNIYAPLALNFGISEWRNELEDLAFKYLEYEEFLKLKVAINKKKEQRSEQIEKIISNLKKQLDAAGLKYEIDGRYKHMYSIYRKMQKKKLSLDELYDLSAIRIIVDDIVDCYTALGVVQINYQFLRDRFKDYISNPKPNGYQSLHTAFFHEGEKYEIQIRTHQMHEIAEKGVAAHWIYKGAKGANSGKDEFLANVIKRQQQIYAEAGMAETGTEFVETLTKELNPYALKIYCFSPKSTIFMLDEGATPVDFAYAVHSAVGNTMVGARVNGILVPFDHVLKTDDVVEIQVSENSSGPKPEWLDFVKTGNAKSRIKAFLKEKGKETAFTDGLLDLEKEAKNRKYNLEDLLTDESKNAMINKHNMPNWERLIESIGRKFINGETVIKRLIIIKKDKEEQELRIKLINTSVEDANIDFTQFEREVKKSKKKSKTGIFIQGETDLETSFAACCSPIPGDEIIGFITKGRGVKVHRTDCINILKMTDENRKRLLEATWDREATKNMSFDISLSIEAEDRATLALDINKILVEAKVGVNIFNSRRVNDRAFFEISLKIDNEEQLKSITNKISTLTNVYEIKR